MNTTDNYQLNQWEGSDRIMREDFNADNRKTEEALAGLAQKCATLEAAVADCGNCRIYYTTYVGTGSGKTQLTFPGKPLLVNIMGTNIWLVGIQGADVAISKNAGSGGGWNEAVWSGNSVSFEDNSGDQIFQCNAKSQTYFVVCLMAADA